MMMPPINPTMPMMGNGNGLSMPGFTTLPTYSRSEIMEMVDQHETDVLALRQRMERDYDRYSLTSHVNIDHKTGLALPGLAVYTSNAPRVFADKVISWLTLGELLVRVPHLDVGQHQEEADNLKERFAIGCLRAADERLKSLLQPSLRGQQAFYATVRGGYIGGRALLVKNPRTEETYVDITVWDPMHIHWAVGANGLEWACHKYKKTRAQIEREYGRAVQDGNRSLFSRFGALIRGSSDAEREGIDVYDFYDGQGITVVAGGETLKEYTPHGSPRVPVYLALVGPSPVLQSQAASNLIADVGESVYVGARDVWDKKNDMMSIVLEIVERARDQTVITESRDGKKTLPFNPFEKGTEISTVTGDKIYTLDMQKLSEHTMAAITVILGEEQRATLPFSSYGETPFQLSGFAITQLRQATETVLASRLEAVESMDLQIVNLLYDQFMTGAFDGMRLSGVDSHRNYFVQTIMPEQLQNTCDYTIRLASQLPQDDMSKWATAEIAKKLNLQSDEDILSNIIGIQDAQQAIDKVRAQKAAEGLPEAVLYNLGLSAAQSSASPDDEYAQIAQFYLAELQRLLAIKLGLMPDFAPDKGGANSTSRPPRLGGQRPEVRPNAATGASPEPETSNQGPSFVAPNTPRPGAQGQRDQNRVG